MSRQPTMPAARLTPRPANADRLLQTAWRLFQLKGYRGVTTAELCRLCGVTKPTLYYYFASKEELFIQVLLHQLRGYRAILEQPGPLPDRLARLASTLLESCAADLHGQLRDLAHVKARRNHRRITDAFNGELFDPLTELLRHSMADGELRPADPAFCARAFLGLVNTFVGRTPGSPPASNGGPGTPPAHQELAHQIVTLFLAGAGPLPAVTGAPAAEGGP